MGMENKKKQMTEADIMRAILLAASKLGARIFRNNVGTGWAGKLMSHTRDHTSLFMARPLHAGLCPGSCDLIGWHSVKVTPEMMGCTIAVFTAIEVKTLKGRVAQHQQNFINIVNAHGGCALIARSVEDALEGIKSWGPKLTDRDQGV